MALNRRGFLGLTSGLMAGMLIRQHWISSRSEAASAVNVSAIKRGGQRIALISDLNSSYGSTDYVNQVHRGVKLLKNLRPDLVLCAGDMIAGQKRSLNRSEIDAMWEAFNRNVLDPLRVEQSSFAPCMGNHDASSMRQGGKFIFKLDRERAESFWRKQKNSLGLNFIEADDFPFNYSIKEADNFYLFIDASSADISQADWSWMQKQLSSSTAKSADLRLIVGHLPPYPVSKRKDRPGEVLRHPEKLIELMERHNVAFYISGHHHAWFPSRVGKTNLISLGAMGSGPRQRLNDSNPASQTLTLLDIFKRPKKTIETTIDLNTLKVINPKTLPTTLTSEGLPKSNLRSTQLTY